MDDSRSRSLLGDPKKLLGLRQTLGWTQKTAASKSGYSTRLIRKLETGGNVRPDTLLNVLQCYHEASGAEQWDWTEFLSSEPAPIQNESSTTGSEEVPGHELVQRLEEYFDTVYNQRQVSFVREFASENFIFYGEGTQRQGVGVVEQRAEGLLAGFNPIQMTMEKSFVHENTVIMYWSVRMKHAGEFVGYPATNRWVSVRGNSIVTFQGRTAIQAEDIWEVDDVLRQISGDEPRVI